MFDVSDFLEDVLQARTRDLIYVFEFYSYDYIPFPEPTSGNLSFDPRHAVKRFAGQNISFDLDGDTVTYQRQVIEVPSINKHIGKQFDTASIKFSNVDRTTAAWIINNKIQGMRLVIRMIPRSAPASGVEAASCYQHSIILFVGRVNKPDGFNRRSGNISATQDLGTIEAQIPSRQYQPQCPLVNVFKVPGHDCMGNETMADKSLTYQAAKTCNGSFAQCTDYENTEFFQGIRIVQIESSFVHKSNESFFKKILNILPGISRKKTVVANSIHDGTAYGKPISLILGRWSKELLPLQFQDIGTSINFKMAACVGKIHDFLNIRNESLGFTAPHDIAEHLGEYGGTGTQTQDTVFPDASFHSKLAYITGQCDGSNIETEDPAPKITSLIAGQIVIAAFGVTGANGQISSVFAGYSTGGSTFTTWSDNPIDQARFVITEPSLLAMPRSHIAERATARASGYTLGGIKDVSNAERAFFPDTETARAGVDYKRYMSTSVVLAQSFRYPNGLSPVQLMVPNREANYEFFDPDNPPTNPALLTIYRKRYTSNIEVLEQKKAIDFLYDTLLSSCRGFIRWDSNGRLALDIERPADHAQLREDVSAGATSIKVWDVTPWKPFEVILLEPEPLRGKVLIGTGKLHSEVRTVSTANYSADGNSITIDADATGAMSVAGASGATLASGSSTVAANGYLEYGGAPNEGDTITAIIDGVEVTIIATAENEMGGLPTAAIVEQLMFAVNAEPLLNWYVEASTQIVVSTVKLIIKAKLGVLNFTPALEEDHFAEIANPTTAPTLAASAGSLEAGTYLVAYSYRNANGNTLTSEIASIELADNEQIDVTGITPPAGADSVDWFCSVEADSGVMLLVLNNDGSGFSIDELPAVTEEDVPKFNTTGEEVLRVMMSFAGKALVYADTTRANTLDRTFEWPEGGRQSTVNQVKTKYREAILDFGEQPIVVNDERHQRETGKVNTVDLDLSAVDNFNQASRLCNGYLAKLRDLDFFFKWGSAGEALLLEVGDVVCVSDDSGAWRNVPVRIEDPSYNPKFEINFTARLYSTSAYDDRVIQTDVPLPTGLANYFEGPPAPTALTLSHVETGGAFDSRITGTITPGDFVYGQKARIYVTPPGGSEVLVQTLEPGETDFSVPAPASGTYTIRVEAVALNGVVGGDISDTITITNGAQTAKVQADLAIYRALEMAMEARAIAGAAASSTDQTARDSARHALELAEAAMGVAQHARSIAGGSTTTSATDVLTVQGFS